MEMAKSIFGSRDHDGYVGREEHAKKLQFNYSEEDNDLPDLIDELSVVDGLRPNPGGPFSALTPSMWPQEILAKLGQPECEAGPNDQPDYRFDEFGFRVEEEDGPEQSSKKLLGIPFVENAEQRKQWIAHLEFSHNKEACELTWENVDVVLPRTEKLRQMVRDGIPHSLRPQMWMRLSGALQKKLKTETSYQEIIKASGNDALMTSKQIEKDLLRILPTNACFSNPHGTGIPRLRRILRGIAWLFPDIGYCQGTGVIAACLLLFMEEENAFWMMATIVEDLLPASYYSSTLLGIQADQRVMQTLIANYLASVDETLKKHDIELSLITLHWFLTLFANVVHMKILVRIWDWFFYEGSIVLFQLTLGMLRIKTEDLQHLENSAQIFNSLSDIPGEVDDVEVLFANALEVGGSLSQTVIDTHRRRHLAYLMADQGGLVGNPEAVPNLPKQQLARRQVKRTKSMFQTLLFRGGEDNEPDELKNKNIRQTEILVDLREAILKVARHFLTIEPKLQAHIRLTAEYSSDSHAKDHENFINVARTRKRRAKALHDFERHDDDELGFRKNDIITIISQKDEHCWVGELNGLRGWFPAKFVELLDERSKQYTSAGDDAISETVTDLVRGTLAPAIKQVLEHGMKRPTFLGGPCHPWLFIEEAATREVEKDFDSVYSRLVLCKTYRLDEDGKVLTPEELLYRCVQAVNQSHDDAHAQMDVKLRSLICLGLNEQVLHLWLEVLCSCVEIVQKWYHTWSFVYSPGWVQIKCELRILSQFAFNLNPDWELPPKRGKESQPLKDGVRDMLVKHHLFSWDL
ncbi:small G protein signaling modulator 3 homolog isoform X2 [Episyrphus balteatus]|uniref:small G protein signaling modulator 3 homolog isoform X2 n=1 Tax=Episyrphus balteatus TaxID=286459 RepID=UPI0024851A6A|nr:small G protein signaling modulator 3 homolog isoform X2 [Episyrphus balteatus]